MSETATVQIPVYRTPEGEHVCAGQRIPCHCPFLKWARYGSTLQYQCTWTHQDVIERSDGYLRPCSGCPIKQQMID